MPSCNFRPKKQAKILTFNVEKKAPSHTLVTKREENEKHKRQKEQQRIFFKALSKNKFLQFFSCFCQFQYRIRFLFLIIFLIIHKKKNLKFLSKTFKLFHKMKKLILIFFFFIQRFTFINRKCIKFSKQKNSIIFHILLFLPILG